MDIARAAIDTEQKCLDAERNRQPSIMDSSESPSPNPRDEPFGYVCHRCLKCCHHKRIQVNPYEIARLARNRGLTTSEFRDTWTEDGVGNYLSQTENGACVFLGSEGCTVHPDRPLVCRLYPLGRHMTEGVEWFSHVEPHPQSAGEFNRNGTIADFLIAQGVEPFMRAADEYVYWICALTASMDDVCKTSGTELSASAAVDRARDLLDVDGAIAWHCAATGEVEPSDIEARKELHLRILYESLNLVKTEGLHRERAQEEP